MRTREPASFSRGKRDNRHRSATGFSGIVTQTGYRMSVAILRSGEGSIFFNINNHANFSGEKKKDCNEA